MTAWLVALGLPVASALVVALTTKAPGKAWAWIRRRMAADHASLHAPSWGLGHGLYSTNLYGVRVRVRAAPARSLFRDREFDPGAAVRFLRRAFPEFPSDPVYSSSTEGVRFEQPEGVEHGYVWAWRNGCIELDHFVAAHTDADGGATLPVADLLVPIDRVATAIAGAGYAQVFGPSARLRWRSRHDWFISVSTTLTPPGGYAQSWSDLIFVGRRPARAARQAAFCPVGGYAARQLRGWKTRPDDANLLRHFLQDFLGHNGYHDTHGAIEDALVDHFAPS